MRKTIFFRKGVIWASDKLCEIIILRTFNHSHYMEKVLSRAIYIHM